MNRSGYAVEYYDDTPTLGSGTLLPTQSGVTVPGITVQLSPGGTIIGTVKDPQGGRASARVYLYSALDSTRQASSVNSTGPFTLSNVQPGDYKLDVDTAGTGFAPTWYGNKATFEEAAAITVTEGGTVSGLDIVLQNGVRADFSGDRKSDFAWRHAVNGEVWIWSMSGGTCSAETYVTSVGDTSYRIVGTGDHNGDGKADILWHHAARGGVWVWLMNGATLQAQSWLGTDGDTGYHAIDPR